MLRILECADTSALFESGEMSPQSKVSELTAFALQRK
jgi:hypothetical protein